MGERKGQNKYYPPDFDPAKHRSLDGYHGSHPLRERAKRLKSEGILIIRFEMPYNIWCAGCCKPIGMGVRYNAEKTKVGYYYSTPIYKFRMKCAMCDQRFEIQTDPKNQDYVILSGARRKEQRWDATQNEQVVPELRETQKKLKADPMFALEHLSDDFKKKEETVPTIEKLELQQRRWRDDYELNKIVRDKFRTEKKELIKARQADSILLEKSSLHLKLLPEVSSDNVVAKLIKYENVNDGKSYEERQVEKRTAIDNQLLFANKVSKTQPYLSLPEKKTFKLQQLKMKAHKESVAKAYDLANKDRGLIKLTKKPSIQSPCGNNIDVHNEMITLPHHYTNTHVDNDLNPDRCLVAGSSSVLKRICEYTDSTSESE